MLLDVLGLRCMCKIGGLWMNPIKLVSILRRLYILMAGITLMVNSMTTTTKEQIQELVDELITDYAGQTVYVSWPEGEAYHIWQDGFNVPATHRGTGVDISIPDWVDDCPIFGDDYNDFVNELTVVFGHE